MERTRRISFRQIRFGGTNSTYSSPDGEVERPKTPYAIPLAAGPTAPPVRTRRPKATGIIVDRFDCIAIRCSGEPIVGRHGRQASNLPAWSSVAARRRKPHIRPSMNVMEEAMAAYLNDRIEFANGEDSAA